MRGQTPIQRDGTKRLADSETQPQPLESLLSKNRFPNRSSLRIHEVSDALQLTFGSVQARDRRPHFQVTQTEIDPDAGIR